jgi:hypothetical protein
MFEGRGMIDGEEGVDRTLTGDVVPSPEDGVEHRRHEADWGQPV